MPANLQHTLDFLRDLKENNNRPWFQENRARYEVARAAFEEFVADLIDRLHTIDDLGSLHPEDTMYRINRDVRFSPDKSPYKTAMGALIGKGGRKTMGHAYYFQVEPNNHSLLAGGMYMVFPAQLDKIRATIAEDSTPLRNILETASFKRYFGQMTGEQLKTTPKGYPKDHPDIDLLRYKQFMADHPISDQELLRDDLADHALEVCKAMKPFNLYIYKLVEGIPVPVRER
jgi:uncharacterized protein (TIGR02453 family)